DPTDGCSSSHTEGPRGIALERKDRVVELYTAAQRGGPLDPTGPFVYSYCTVRADPDPRPTVGLIGLGRMGSAIGERLLDAGYELLVWNRTSAKAEPLVERGAVACATVADLAQGADVILSSLA